MSIEDDDPLLGMTPDEEATLYRNNLARERTLWGSLLKDKRTLQCAGFAVWKRGGQLFVDSKRLTRAAFVEKAARERRLREAK